MNTSTPLPPIPVTSAELTLALWFSLLQSQLARSADRMATFEAYVEKWGWVGIHPKAQESIRRVVVDE